VQTTDEEPTQVGQDPELETQKQPPRRSTKRLFNVKTDG
jgi:hypothetical protein